MEAARHRHGARVDGLPARAASKLAEVDARIADLRVIRATLVAALDAGCDDLVARSPGAFVVDRLRPDRWDALGAMLCLAGVAVIMYAPRG